MATHLIDTTGCNSDYVVSLSIPHTTGTFLTVLTIQDSGLNASFFASNSIVISTTSGYSFYGGGNSEYIRRSGDSLTFASMTSNWVLINTYAYSAAGYAFLSTVSTTNFFGVGAASLSTVIIQGILSNTGPTDEQNIPSVKGIPVTSQSNLFSTVVGLGSLGYFSSIPAMMSTFTSTVEGLSGYSIGYISSTQFRSTVAGLGPTYVSTGALTSTMAGLGLLYVSSKSLVSTVAGMGTAGYISATQIVSTVQGLGTFGYISTPQVVSTVNWAMSVTASNNASTFINLGLLYISTPSLVSTVIGASNYYINSNHFTSSIYGVTAYFSIPIVSTVAGLGSAGYISTYSLYSTVGGVIADNQSNVSYTISSLGLLYVSSLSLQSTVAGLGLGFVSLPHLTSTTAGALERSQSNMNSTVAGLGQTYTSTLQFFSTAVGLSNVAAVALPSTLDGLGITYISSLTLQSTVGGLGQIYVSIDQLISTSSNVLAGIAVSLPSTLDGLGSVGYISFAQTISTVSTIATFNQSTLISTVNGLGQPYVSTLTLQSTVAGLGQLYISLDQLTSTTSNVLSLGKSYVQSTFAGLGTAGFISYPQTLSTVIGFCNLNRSNLISTVDTIGPLYISSLSLQSTVAGLGTFGYVSLSQLTSTTYSITKLASDYILSTFLGMSNVGYVSISELSSTLTGLREMDVRDFISAVNSFGQTYISSLSLQSTVAGLGTFGYVSTTWIASTTDGLTLAQSNTIFANVAGLGSKTFISTSQLVSTVAGIHSNTDVTDTSTVKTFGRNYISSLSLQSTVTGLGTMNFVTPAQATAASDLVHDDRFIVNPTLDPTGFSNLDDKVSRLVVGKFLTIPQALSTTSNFNVTYRLNLVSTVNTLDSFYIKTGLTSTVVGLGTYGYLSVPDMISTVSTMIGGSSNAIQSTFTGLATAGYISMSQLASTTEGVFSNAPFFGSTVAGLGSLYISSLSLQSTVGGLSNYYVTTSQLVSTTLGLSNPTSIPPSMFSSVAGLGGTYVSSLSLQSTVAGLGATYVYKPNLISTVTGLGSYGYLSTPYLVSTFVGYSNPMPQIISTTAGLGNYYISTPTGTIIFPDQYRTQTKYMGKSVTAIAYSPSYLFFADATTIYKSAYSPITATVFASLANVTDMVCDSTYVYVSYGNKIVSYVISSGSGPTDIANSGNTAGFANSSDSNVASSVGNVSFRSIQGMCIDKGYSNLYVCDTGNNLIRRVQLSPLSVTTIATVSQPFSIIVDPPSQYIYVSGAAGITKISLFQSNGTLLTTQGAYSQGMCIDQSGTLAYVTSQLYSYVIEVNLSNGIVNTIGGTSGNPGLLDGTTSLFYSPQGITYNPGDTCIYVADTGNMAIRQIASKIYYSTIQGMLSRGYSSNVLMKVPSGGTSGQFITASSLQLWLDAADPYATGTAPANGTLLTIWNDKSGNSNHAIPVNTPLYSNGYIQLLPNSYFVSPYVMNSSQHHIFIVCQYQTSGTFQINLLSGMSNDCIQVYIYNNTLVLGSPYSSQNRATVSPSIPFVVEIKTTASNSTISINNGTAVTGGGYPYGISRTQIGGSTVSMYVCEVLMYNKIMSGLTVYSRLNTKWISPATGVSGTVTAVNASNAIITTSNAALVTNNAANATLVRQTGITLWLDGADPNGTGVLPAVGSAITTWVDKSGYGNNALGSGFVSSNGIIFNGADFFNTPVATNILNTYIYIVFSNSRLASTTPLIGVSEGFNVGYELLLTQDKPTMQMSYYPASGTTYFTTNVLPYPFADQQFFRLARGLRIINVPATSTWPKPGLKLFVTDFGQPCYYAYNIENPIGNPYIFYENSTFNPRFGITLTLPQNIIGLPLGYVVQTDTSQEYLIVANYTSNTKSHVSIQIRSYAYGITAGPSDLDTFVFLVARFGGSGNYITTVTMTRDSSSTYYTDFSSSYCQNVENDPDKNLNGSEHIVYNPVTGYYYYTNTYTIWEMHSLLTSDTHTKIAGNGTAGFANGGGTNAIFNYASGITVDLDGNLYVADRLNGRIRRIDIDSLEVTTLPGRYAGVFDITYNKRNGIEYLYISAHGNTSETYNASKVIEIALNNPVNLNKVVISSNAITSTNTIINANYIGGSVSASNYYYGSKIINPTALAVGADGYPEYGTPGTYQVGLYYNPSPIYLIGSIQEVIIYTSPTPLASLLYNSSIMTYLYNKWNRSSPSYIPPYVIPYLPLPLQTAPASGVIITLGTSSGTTTTNNISFSGSILSMGTNLYAGNITANGLTAATFYGDGSGVTSISDRRLKEDIRPIMNALDKVSSMQAVRYRLYKDPSHVWIGYIAQDLEVILPEVVRTDEQGWKSIQYANLPALIIEAVKELNEKYARIKYLLSTST